MKKIKLKNEFNAAIWYNHFELRHKILEHGTTIVVTVVFIVVVAAVVDIVFNVAAVIAIVTETSPGIEYKFLILLTSVL